MPRAISATPTRSTGRRDSISTRTELGDNPLQSARWLSLAAKQGPCRAQAKLGDILFNGDGGLKANRVEGLMWLTVADRRALRHAPTPAGSTIC